MRFLRAAIFVLVFFSIRCVSFYELSIYRLTDRSVKSIVQSNEREREGERGREKERKEGWRDEVEGIGEMETEQLGRCRSTRNVQTGLCNSDHRRFQLRPRLNFSRLRSQVYRKVHSHHGNT